MTDFKPIVSMVEFKPIVSMVEFKGQIIVATSDGVYRMNDGKPELIAGPEHFRQADEEWGQERLQENGKQK